MRVLIVDDAIPMRLLVKNALQLYGITEIVEGRNGKEALDIIKESKEQPSRKIDLLISDWNMEPVSGLDLLKSVRNDSDTSDIPFMMLTAEDSREQIVLAMQSGVDDYIIKPFDMKLLKTKLADISRKKIAEIRKEIDTLTLGLSGDSSGYEEEVKRSIEEIKRAGDIAPWSPIGPYETGRLWFWMEDYANAEKYLRQAVSKDFGFTAAHELLSKALKKSGKIPESVKELEVAVAMNPNSAELKRKLGEAYLKNMEFDKAIKYLSSAVNLFEIDDNKKLLAVSKSVLGKAKVNKGDEEKNTLLIDEGVEEIREAVELGPEMISAHYNLMVAYKKAGRSKEASEILESIQKMEPEDPEDWVGFGKAYLEKDERSKSFFAFNKAIELSGGAFLVYEEMCNAFFNHKMYDEALPYLQKAAESNPSDIFSYNMKGIIYRAKGDYENSIKEYTRALELEPENAAILYNLGVAHAKAGDTEKSEELIAKAREMDPELGA